MKELDDTDLTKQETTDKWGAKCNELWGGENGNHISICTSAIRIA